MTPISKIPKIGDRLIYLDSDGIKKPFEVTEAIENPGDGIIGMKYDDGQEDNIVAVFYGENCKGIKTKTFNNYIFEGEK